MALPDRHTFESQITPEKTLTITSAMVDSSPAFIRYLTIFGLDNLLITNAAVTVLENDGTNFSVEGQTQLWNIAVTNVDLYFQYTDSTHFEFQLVGVFAELSLNLVIEKGVLPSNDTNQIGALLGHSYQNVNITFDSSSQYLYLSILESDLQLAFPDTQNSLLTLASVGFEFIRHYVDDRTDFLLRTTFLLGTTAIAVLIEMPIGGTNPDAHWTIRNIDPINLLAGISDFVSFIEHSQIGQTLGIANFGSLFPEDIHNMPLLVLNNVELQFNPQTSSFQYATLTLATGSPMLLGDGFMVEQVGVNIRIVFWENQSNIHLTLFGLLNLNEDAFFNIEISLPTNTTDPWSIKLSGAVDFSDITHVNNLPTGVSTSDMHLPQKFFEIQQLNIDQFSATYQPSVGVSEIVFAINSVLEVGIPPIISLQNPMIYLIVTYDGQTRSIDGSQISGVIQLGTLVLSLEADKIANGWSFVGKTIGVFRIGDVIASLGDQFGIHDIQGLSNFTLDDLEMRFSTISGSDPQKEATSFDLTCTCSLPFDGKVAQASLQIHVEHQGSGSYNRTVGGSLMIGGYQFTVGIGSTNQTHYVLATYQHNEAEDFHLKQLLNYVSESIADVIPDVVINVKTVALLYYNAGGENVYIFGVDVNLGIDLLSYIPLIGDQLPASDNVRLGDVRVVVVSRNLTTVELTSVNAILPADVKIPQAQSAPNQPIDPQAVAAQRGFNFAANLTIGTDRQYAFSTGSNGTPVSPPAGATPPTASSAVVDDATWLKIQRSLGPVYIGRIGFRYHEATIDFLVDGSLTALGLTLALQGLTLGVTVGKNPGFAGFSLRGLSLDYKNGPVEIGGAFLSSKIAYPPGGPQYDAYSGQVVVRTENLSLNAIGSYMLLPQGPSLFVYMILDYPIGGPAFFFVRGLAGGFGYNRTLNLPTVDKIADFPLITEAMQPLAGTPDLATELAKLQNFVPPSVGNFFLAIGIHFTTFEMIDSFILLTVLFGNRFELDILGLSTLILPAPDAASAGITPITEVQLAIRATFAPDDGFFGIAAQLTSNSFLLSRACHLTGGFAFYSWFSGDHEGDFVLSVGGYHPRFQRPQHYPIVPRLGFNWQVTDQLSLKGSAYFALVPSALMAGGSINASYQDGKLNAWFDASMDFLISWKPYHYEADFHVSVGASYTFWFFGTQHIRVHVGADVSLWGPEFAGKAYVDISVISFTIYFGAYHNKNTLKGVSWTTFSTSFLPETSKTCTINLAAGTVNKGTSASDANTSDSNQRDFGVVNPKDLRLISSTAVPIKKAYQVNAGAQTELGYSVNGTAAFVGFSVGAMELGNQQLVSDYKITITRDNHPLNNGFVFHPILKTAPAALWGTLLKPDLNGNQIIPNLLMGYEIVPEPRVEAANPLQVLYSVLLSDAVLDSEHDAFVWGQVSALQSQHTDDPNARWAIIQQTLHDERTAHRRQALVNDLIVGFTIEIGDLAENNFSVVPQIALG